MDFLFILHGKSLSISLFEVDITKRVGRHPTHLKPINNQIFQYMQLTISMISDLDLERKMQSPIEAVTDRAIARNTVLGCYFLSARWVHASTEHSDSMSNRFNSIAMGFKRSNNFTFSPPDEMLSSMLLSNDQTEPFIASTVLLCRFIEKIHSLNLRTEITKLSSWTECPLQKLTQSLLTELRQLESDLPTHIHANSKYPIESPTLLTPFFRQGN